MQRYWNVGGMLNPCVFGFQGRHKCQLPPFSSNDTLSYGKLLVLSTAPTSSAEIPNATPYQQAAAAPNLGCLKSLNVGCDCEIETGFQEVAVAGHSRAHNTNSRQSTFRHSSHRGVVGGETEGHKREHRKHG